MFALVHEVEGLIPCFILSPLVQEKHMAFDSPFRLSLRALSTTYTSKVTL